jgi:hypothetical protein
MARAATAPRKVPFGTTPSERVTMARALSALFVAGGLLLVATVLLPHSANTTDLGVVGPGALAVVMGALLYRYADRIGVTELQLLLAFGAFLITVCVIYGGDSSNAYPYLYLWVSLYAYYFFSTRVAAELVVLCIGLYALAFRLEDDTPVAAVHWLMATGTVVVGGLMIGRLTAAIRAQAEDLAAVSRMAGGLSSLDDFAQVTCESLRGSVGADVVIFLEPVELGAGLHVTAMAGTAEAGTAFAGSAARIGLEHAFRDGAPVELTTDPGAVRSRPFAGHVLGLAQPVLRDGSTAAVLAVAWTRPRRALSARLRTAALLFAAEASLALDRAERASQAREQQALEINDNIVQGLVVAKYSAQRGDMEEAIRALDETLGRARRLITDQLQSVAHRRSGAIRPGDLARSEASSLDDDVPVQALKPAGAPGA